MSNKLPVIKFKKFQKYIEKLGFEFIARNGTHYVYINKEEEQIILPYSGKEVNPIMAKVILDRIKHNHLAKHQKGNVLRTKGLSKL